MTHPETLLPCLLPCAFCGGEAKRRRDRKSFNYVYCDAAGCLKPETDGHTDRIIELTDRQWNRRNQQQPATSNDGLREALTIAVIRMKEYATCLVDDNMSDLEIGTLNKDIAIVRAALAQTSDTVITVSATLERYRKALEFYASGIGHSEYEDNGAMARSALTPAATTESKDDERN